MGQMFANSESTIKAGLVRVESQTAKFPDKEEDAEVLDEASLAALIEFFRLLDRWECEAKTPC